jgi:hypothetical protein
VVDYVNGFALAEVSGPLGQSGDRRELLARLAAGPAERFPTMLHVFGSLTENEMGADFEFGLGVVLAGLEATSGHAGEHTDGPR